MNQRFLILVFSIVIILNLSFAQENDINSVEFDLTNSSTTGITNGTNPPLELCESLISCSECQSEINCIWCADGDGACLNGHWFGPEGSCSDWRWKQCFISSLYLIFACLGFALLIICVCCVCLIRCCYCRKSKKHKYEMSIFKESKVFRAQKEEQEGLLEKSGHEKSRHPKTDAKREELKKKYGISEP